MNTTEIQTNSKMLQLRRSQRVCLRLPIVVLREGPGTNVASEETHTLIVNAHGALRQLALTVEIGQLLGIKNMQTLEELVCRVVNLAPISRASEKWASSLNLLPRDFGESLFRLRIGLLAALMQKRRRRTHLAASHNKRKPAAYRSRLTKRS